MKLEGCVALVTGANRGLGKALVDALLEAGAARVWATARDVGSIAAADVRVAPIELDTTNPASVARAAEVASDVTLLVNNAGLATSWNVLTMDGAAFENDFRTNVQGTLRVIRAFVPVLERAARGGYAASKAAAYSITQALRPELRKRSIAVFAALPGPIDTDMVRDLKMPKTSAADVARGVLAGVEREEEEIFPDPMAREMGALWNRSPKDYERAFASF